MTTRPTTALAFTLIATLLSGCATSRVQRAAGRPAPISHFVLIKLAAGDDDTDAFIADSDSLLAGIPGVRAYTRGSPFVTGRGAPVDLDFDVAFYFGFDTRADYEAYQDHPQHRAILDRWRDRIEWIRVHDMIDEAD